MQQKSKKERGWGDNWSWLVYWIEIPLVVILDFVEVKKLFKKSHGIQIQLSYQKNTVGFHVQQETARGFWWAAKLDPKARDVCQLRRVASWK